MPLLVCLPAADVQGILDDIQGKPCSIDCDSQGMCTFDIQDFFVTLVAPCQTAACVVPGYTFVEGASDAAERGCLYGVGWMVVTAYAYSVYARELCLLSRPWVPYFLFPFVSPISSTHPNPPHPNPAGDYTITTSQSYDPVIAAIPVMVLGGLAAFLSLYLIRLRQGWEGAGRGGGY